MTPRPIAFSLVLTLLPAPAFALRQLESRETPTTLTSLTAGLEQAA